MRDPKIDRDTRWRFNGAINVDDVDTVSRMLKEYPGFRRELAVSIHCGLHNAAMHGSLETAKFLIEEMGCDVNHPESSTGSFPIDLAVGHSGINMVKFLLDHGANPNVGRLLLSTIGQKDETEELEIVKLLLDHGIEVNKEFQWFDTDATFTPLEFAEMHDRPQIAKLLREYGAKDRAPKSRPAPKTRSEEIVAHLEHQYGPVRPEALIEIVPTGMPISIHMIPPTEEHQRLTLFTTGMSEKAMRVPAEPTGLFRFLAKTSEEEKAVIEHQRQYRFAELVMHLPADWPTSGDAMQQHQYAWPFLWLKTIARYPHEQRTWLGGPITIFAASDPPEPLADNTQLAAFMLAAKTEMTCKDDTLIQFFTVVPIYAEERELEMREGLPALLNKLDEHGIGDTVDLSRINVGTE